VTQTSVRRTNSAEFCEPWSERAGRVAPDRVADIVALYADGVKIVEIGQRFKIGHRAARRVLVDAGVAIRPRGRRPMLAEHKSEIARLRREGWSYQRIADRLGVGATTVRDFDRQHALV